MWYGISLILIYLALDLIQNFVWMQSNFLQSVLAVKCSHGVVSLIYEKVLKISSATNKEFTQGEIINFINVDVSKIDQVANDFSKGLLIQLIFASVFLFYYFGEALLSAFAVGAIISLINFIIAKIRANLQAKMLSCKDSRMRSTTEAIDNIKVIKLYSWKELFIQKVFKIRNRELMLIKIETLLDALEWFMAWMIAPSLIISTLLTFFLMGNTITIARLFAAIHVFSLLELALRYFPEFIKSFLEFTVSMERIQKFLL